MTSIEWLFEQLEKKGDMRETPSIRNLQLNIDTSDYLELKRLAKEMHRLEIGGAQSYAISNADNDNGYFDCDKYYQKTFVSKGSDEHIVDTNEMIYPKTAFEILQPKLTIADTLEFREKHLPEILDAMEEYATFSQTEISNEEIENVAWEKYTGDSARLAWVEAIKWYREQLKQKQ